MPNQNNSITGLGPEKAVFFTKEQLKKHFEARGINTNAQADPIIDGLIAKGAIIEGINEQSGQEFIRKNRAAVDNRYNNIRTAWDDAGQGVKPFAKAVVKTVGNIAGGANDIIGNAITGLDKDLTGGKITGSIGSVVQKVADSSAGQAIESKYDQYVPEGSLRRDTAEAAGNVVSLLGVKGAGKGISKAVGSATPLVKEAVETGVDIAKNAAIKIAPDTNALASRMNNSIIKPSKNDFAYGKNPGETMAKYGISGDLETITKQSFEKMKEVDMKMKSIADELDTTFYSKDTLGKEKVSVKGKKKTNYSDQENKQSAQQLEYKPTNLSLENSYKIIDDGIKTAIANNDTTIATRLQAVKEALTKDIKTIKNPDGTIIKGESISKDISNLSFKQAWNERKRLKNFTKWTGNASDDAFVNDIMQKVYKSANEQLDNYAKKANPKLAKEWKELNQDYSGLIKVGESASDRAKVLERQNAVSVGDIGATGAAAVIGSAITGGSALLPAVIGYSGNKLIKSPKFMSKVAKELYKKPEVKGAMQTITKLTPEERAALVKELLKGLQQTDKALPTTVDLKDE